jgi:hypothetical protein
MRKRIEKLEEKVKEIQKEISELKKKVRKAPAIGEVIEIAGIKWKILDKTTDGYFAITEDFINDSTEFDSKSNNWANSDLRAYLNTGFLKKIEEEIGNDSLVTFERELLSLDGQVEYGKCMDKVSLLTVDEYRRYRSLLPNTGDWWWTCTPWSTKSNGYERQVAVVSPSGCFSNGGYFYGRGVRPVCIFSSSIFESEE